MKSLVLAVLIAIVGVAVWVWLKAKYDLKNRFRRLSWNRHKDPRFREGALFCSMLVMSLIIFMTMPGWL